MGPENSLLMSVCRASLGVCAEAVLQCVSKPDQCHTEPVFLLDGSYARRQPAAGARVDHGAEQPRRHVQEQNRCRSAFTQKHGNKCIDGHCFARGALECRQHVRSDRPAVILGSRHGSIEEFTLVTLCVTLSGTQVRWASTTTLTTGRSTAASTARWTTTALTSPSSRCPNSQVEHLHPHHHFLISASSSGHHP